MLHFDTNNPSNTDTNTSSKSLFAFKPRQVILAERNPRSKMTAFALKEENSSKITSLTPELKGIFHQSILHYLHRNGYSRTLKRFQSEAQIQSDTWKVSSLHLEDIFCKYNACNADSNLNTNKKPVLGNDEVIKKDNVCATDEETTSKKKKKGTIESDNGAIEDQSEVIDKKMVQSGKNCGQISDIIVHELETKPKKKKTKHDVDSSSQAQEAKSNLLKKPVDGTINGLKIDDSTKKTKDKKKKGTVESASCAIEDQSNVTNKKIVESGQNCGQISEDIIVNELETKPKKKKTKHDSDSPGAAEVKSDVSKKPVDDTINGLEMDESTKKKKDKKKKGTVESDNGAFKDQSKVTDKKMVESGKNCGQILEDIIVNERETKPKKKKMKPDLDSDGQAEEAKSAVLKKPIDDTINGLDIDDLTKKTKDKKKKSVQQDKAEPSTTNENEFITEVAQKERENKKKLNTHSAVEDDQVNPVRIEAENETSQPDVSRKEKKSSKKRKRSLSDENDHLSSEMTISEESKRQKTETSKEEKNKKEGSKVNEINAQETSNKQLDGQENGKLESSAQKSTRKQSNSSAEPKTVNAFQRVKIDRVEFAHEKLQDNSYWAKDGAEIGYGAKAQEVLGQVRGRDFRHEKTKKKRGSYRGGLIDLQSHSVKFNYPDDEE